MKLLDNLPILAFESSDALHAWLEAHYRSSHGIWLRLYKKNSGICSVAFEEVLDEGLCFGWSESARRSFDKNSYLQKFTPRKLKGTKSARNIARANILTQQGKMKPEGLTALGIS